MTKVCYINLTPHKIVVYNKKNEKIEIQPSGMVARVSVTPKTIAEIDNIPIHANTYGDIVFGNRIINNESDIFDFVSKNEHEKCQYVLIVSYIVLQSLKSKNINTIYPGITIVAPDTSPGSVIRDENGRIIGVKAFQTIV